MNTSSTYPFHPSFESKSHHHLLNDLNDSSLHSKCDSLSYHPAKEILRLRKAQDSLLRKTLLEKTSGLNDNCSSSHLVYSSWSKSKVTAPEHFKSPLSNRISTLPFSNSDDGEQSLYSFRIVALILIILILLYSVMIKPWHLTFDRGKQLISKHSL